MSDNPNEINSQQAPDNPSVPVDLSGHGQGDEEALIERLLPRIESKLEIEVRQELSQYSGPLPDPDTYQKYAELIPNGAERIMHMAEHEQEHRHGMERMQEWRATGGVLTGFLVAAMGFGAAGYALFLSFPWGAIGIAGATLAALVKVFVHGTATNNVSNNQEKSNGEQTDKSRRDE